MQALHINGNDLTLEEVRDAAVERRPVLLDPAAREAVDRARAVVDALVANNKVSYAITTGVGQLADVRIAGEQIRELQVNLVRSHAAGVGEPLSEEETRAMMLLRANSLAKGLSGVRAQVIEMLCEMLNQGVHPVIPSQGSVGASGDLAPLAHLALSLIGEGEAFFEGQRMTSAEALQRARLTPVQLEAKEGLALLNGTQAMHAVGGLALLCAQRLARVANVAGAMNIGPACGKSCCENDFLPHPARFSDLQGNHIGRGRGTGPGEARRAGTGDDPVPRRGSPLLARPAGRPAAVRRGGPARGRSARSGCI